MGPIWSIFFHFHNEDIDHDVCGRGLEAGTPVIVGAGYMKVVKVRDRLEINDSTQASKMNVLQKACSLFSFSLSFSFWMWRQEWLFDFHTASYIKSVE